jgi:signal transduction histidine kinase
MMENLINDLLDLAKLENNTFQLTNDYFNLSSTIYEAFQILKFTATEKKIELKAEIDSNVNLKLIQSILGDQRRYI